MTRFLALLAIFTLSACATLTKSGEGIKVVSQDFMMENCQKMSEIDLNKQFGIPNYNEAAIAEVRNQAAALGANAIFIKEFRSDMRSGATVRAIALSCNQ